MNPEEIQRVKDLLPTTFGSDDERSHRHDNTVTMHRRGI